MTPSLSDPSGPNVNLSLSRSRSISTFLSSSRSTRARGAYQYHLLCSFHETYSTIISLALSIGIAPSSSFSPSCQETFKLLSSSLFLSSSARSFLALTSVLFPTSPLTCFPFLTLPPFSPYHCLSALQASSSVARRGCSSLFPFHSLSHGDPLLRTGPRSAIPLPLPNNSPLLSPPSSPSSTRDSSFDSPRASRRRLAEIFSLLPSRNEQCGGSGMQDGRRVLEPRATRTLPIDRNERDIVRTRETSSGSGQRRKIKREEERENTEITTRERETRKKDE